MIMKLRDFLVAGTLGLFAACHTPYRATDTTVVVAPSGTQAAFIAQYPSASNVVWTHYDQAMVMPIDWDMAGWTALDERDYVVRFNVNNEDYYAWYDENGDWIGTAYVVKDYKTMPTIVSDAVSRQFPGYTISGVTRQFQKQTALYEVELKNSDTKVKLLVDGNGNIVKQKSKALY
jgi:hypothetical protein